MHFAENGNRPSAVEAMAINVVPADDARIVKN